MAWAPTTTQILDMDGVRARADDFTFELLRGAGVIGELRPDPGRPPVVQWNGTDTVKRKLTSFHLPASEADDVNPLTDKVRVMMTLQNGDSETLGTFQWADDSEPERPWGLERASSLVDQTADMDQGSSFPIAWPTRVSVVTAAVYVAQQVLPSSQITYTPGLAATPDPVSYPTGTSRMRILGDFMKIQAYFPPHMDRHSQFYLVDVPDIDAVIPVCSYDDDTRIYADSINRDNDLLRAPNRYTVTSSNGQGNSFRGFYDVPDSAPHSAANRDGRIITHNENVPGIATQEAADKAARNLARATGPGYKYLQFTGPADWRHDAYTVCRVFGDNYLDVAWSLTCRSGGGMTHTVRRPY